MDRIPVYVYHHRGAHLKKSDLPSDPATGQDAATVKAALEASPSSAAVLDKGARFTYRLPTLTGSAVMIEMWATADERLVVSRVPLLHLYQKRLNSTCKVWLNSEEEE